MQPENNPENNWYVRKGLTPPQRISHGVKDDEISERVKSLNPHSWRLEGNRLIAKTEMGELVNYINPNYILIGTDSEGLPKFKRVV